MKKLIPWLLVIAAWEAASSFSPAVPSALRIFRLVGVEFEDPTFLTALAGSLRRMAIGYVAVCVLGVGLGMLLGKVRWLHDILGTVAVLLHAMPGAAWVPLAVVLFGLNEAAVIFTVLLGATGVVMVNTSSGIQEVPPLLLRAARTMGAGGMRIFWHVILPAAVPRIADGLRLAWAFGWRALMAGELLVSSVHGMGKILNDVARRGDLEQLLAFMAVIALIGLAADHLVFRRLEGLIRLRWGMA